MSVAITRLSARQAVDLRPVGGFGFRRFAPLGGVPTRGTA
jgi:hypothetical protein